MPPGYFYYAALVLIVIPSMWINRMAALVAVVWIIGQFAYLSGLPDGVADMSLDLIALFAAMLIARADGGYWKLITGLLFAPMFAVHVAEYQQQLHPYYAWWSIFWLAMLQVVTVPLSNDWQYMREAWHSIRDLSWMDKVLRTRA